MAMRKKRAHGARLCDDSIDCGNYGHKSSTVTRFLGERYTDFAVVKNTRSQVCPANRNFGKTALLEKIRPPALPGGRSH
jgi:hypothetical protein